MASPSQQMMKRVDWGKSSSGQCQDWTHTEPTSVDTG